MRKWLAVGFCLFLPYIYGCESEQVANMEGNTVVTDPALDAFESGHLMGLGYAATGPQPNWAEVKKLASSDSFKSGISTFESAALPSEKDATKKAAFVAAAKKLSEAGSNAEVEAAYKEMVTAGTAYRN